MIFDILKHLNPTKLDHVSRSIPKSWKDEDVEAYMDQKAQEGFWFAGGDSKRLFFVRHSRFHYLVSDVEPDAWDEDEAEDDEDDEDEDEL